MNLYLSYIKNLEDLKPLFENFKKIILIKINIEIMKIKLINFYYKNYLCFYFVVNLRKLTIFILNLNLIEPFKT